MADQTKDYLTVYRKFFDKFNLTVDPHDQLPVKVAGYNVAEFEITGAVMDWTNQYLTQRQCPPSLIAPLTRSVVEEMLQLCKKQPEVCGYRSHETDYLTLRLMQTAMRTLVDVCTRYQDNAQLSTLPPPREGPLVPLVSSCAVKNSRRTMEDRHVVVEDLHTLFDIQKCEPASYYGVFDGHNGVDAAMYSVAHLHQFLVESKHYPAKPELAMRDAFRKTDAHFIAKCIEENLHSGTTALCALLRPLERMLYVGWAGDSQAVLVRRGRISQLVRPHKPDRPDERERIEKAGGTVLFWGTWRVQGLLAVSRAIGNVEYKPFVSSEPDILSIPLDGTEDFLILACDGLWDFVSEVDAAKAVYTQLSASPGDVEGVSQRLVQLSKEQNSSDNISVVVVLLAEAAQIAASAHLPLAMETEQLAAPGAAAPAPTNGNCRGYAHGEEDDFGPETDVDAVDDILLSPAIAAAKAIAQQRKGIHDDIERQRQQMSEFDDPADLERARDTPTPPASEVVGTPEEDNVGDSEESDEEWNYIQGACEGSEQKKAEREKTALEEEDMESQLNPNAAEFVPVFPAVGSIEPVIACSPKRGAERSLDSVPVPLHKEFVSEAAQRPNDINGDNSPQSQVSSDEEFGAEKENLQVEEKEMSASMNCSTSPPMFNNRPTYSFILSKNSPKSPPSDADVPISKELKLNDTNPFQDSSQCTEQSIEVIDVTKTNDAFGVDIGLRNTQKTLHEINSVSSEFVGSTDSPLTEDDFVLGTPRSAVVAAPTSPLQFEMSPFLPDREFEMKGDFICSEDKSCQSRDQSFSPTGGEPLENIIPSQSGLDSFCNHAKGALFTGSKFDNATNFPNTLMPIDIQESNACICKALKSVENDDSFEKDLSVDHNKSSNKFDIFDSDSFTHVKSGQDPVHSSESPAFFGGSNSPQVKPLSPFVTLRSSFASDSQHEFQDLQSPVEETSDVPNISRALNGKPTHQDQEMLFTSIRGFSDEYKPSINNLFSKSQSKESHPEIDFMNDNEPDVDIPHVSQSDYNVNPDDAADLEFGFSNSQLEIDSVSAQSESEKTFFENPSQEKYDLFVADTKSDINNQFVVSPKLSMEDISNERIESTAKAHDEENTEVKAVEESEKVSILSDGFVDRKDDALTSLVDQEVKPDNLCRTMATDTLISGITPANFLEQLLQADLRTVESQSRTGEMESLLQEYSKPDEVCLSAVKPDILYNMVVNPESPAPKSPLSPVFSTNPFESIIEKESLKLSTKISVTDKIESQDEPQLEILKASSNIVDSTECSKTKFSLGDPENAQILHTESLLKTFDDVTKKNSIHEEHEISNATTQLECFTETLEENINVENENHFKEEHMISKAMHLESLNSILETNIDVDKVNFIKEEHTTAKAVHTEPLNETIVVDIEKINSSGVEHTIPPEPITLESKVNVAGDENSIQEEHDFYKTLQQEYLVKAPVRKVEMTNTIQGEDTFTQTALQSESPTLASVETIKDNLLVKDKVVESKMEERESRKEKLVETEIAEEAKELPSTTETPPPTPSPRLSETEAAQGLLAAAAIAAGAVTAAVVVKKTDGVVATKKPLSTSQNKTTTAGNAGGKATAAQVKVQPKAPTRPSVTAIQDKKTSKPVPISAATKTAASKPVPAKPATVTAKLGTVATKPTASAKPAITKTAVPPTTKPITSLSPKPATPKPTTPPASAKPVLSKASTPTRASPSTPVKPSTPITKPATPKSSTPTALKPKTGDVSPTKSTGAAKITAIAAKQKSTIGSSLMNGDIKPLSKPPPIKKPALSTITKVATATVTNKPEVAAKPALKTAMKPAGPPKPITSTIKPSVATTTTTTKVKLTGVTSTKPIGAKAAAADTIKAKLGAAPTAVSKPKVETGKPAGKEVAIKKSMTNKKTEPGKVASPAKKVPLSKDKPAAVEAAKQEQEPVTQEDIVTTTVTNGHLENGVFEQNGDLSLQSHQEIIKAN